MLDDRVRDVLARLEAEDEEERRQGLPPERRSRAVAPTTGRFLFSLVAPQTGGLTVRCDSDPVDGRMMCHVEPLELLNRVDHVTVEVRRSGRVIYGPADLAPNPDGEIFLRLPDSVDGLVEITTNIALREEWAGNGTAEPGPQSRTRRWG